MRGWLFFALWMILGLGILCWGIVLASDNFQFRGMAVVLPGKVIEMRQSQSDSIFMSSPVVEFSLPTGEVKRYESRFSSSITSYSTGDRVNVLWDPASGKIRLDSFGDLFFPALFVLAVAAFILFGPVFCMVVFIWIWGWPTRANLAKMRATIRGER